MNGNTVIKRWQERVEKGLLRLAEKPSRGGSAGRFDEIIRQSRSLLRLNAPLVRLFNGLGEISLRLGFGIFSLLLFRRAEKTDPRDPLAKINLSRAQLSLANRFLLRAPQSGAAAYNLNDGKKRLDILLEKSMLPDRKTVEVTLLARRIEDRLEMWGDIRRGKLDPAAIKDILRSEDQALREAGSSEIPTLEELEKLEPRRVGFYYREYRQEQLRKRGGRNKGGR